MKKSNKKSKEELGQELIKDTENIFNFINKFESIDLETANLDKLQKEIDDISEDLQEKYKDIIEQEKAKKDLDSEE